MPTQTTHTSRYAGHMLVEHNHRACRLWNIIRLEELAKDGVLPPLPHHPSPPRRKLVKINVAGLDTR